MGFDTLRLKAVEGLLSFKNENDNIVSGTHVTACQQQTEYYAFTSRELVSLNVTFVKS